MTATIPNIGFNTGAAKQTQTTATRTEVAPVVSDKPNYRSIYASSIFAVTMLFLLGVGLPASMYLGDYMGGFGLGAFCAFWGGPSFGVMVGAARVSAWLEAHGDDEH